MKLLDLVGTAKEGSEPCPVCGKGTFTWKVFGPRAARGSCNSCDVRMMS